MSSGSIPEADKEIIEWLCKAIEEKRSVPASVIGRWLHHESVDVLSFVAELLCDHQQLIVPPLSIEEIGDAVHDFYSRCLRTDVQSEYVPSRYIAGHELVAWFRYLWSHETAPRHLLENIKVMLKDLYCSGDRTTADVVVNGVLEHLFESPEIVEFFDEWRSDPALGHAYALAKEWTDNPRRQGIHECN
jgi:hypothetical protein